jgi:hypothetical protein
MAGSSRRRADEVLILALAGGSSVRNAAAQAQVSERLVYSRLAEPEFRSRVDAARSDLVSRAVGRLADLGGLAADTLEGVLNDAEVGTRDKLTAARATLEFMLRGVEIDALSREVRELKRQLEGLTRERASGTQTDPAGTGVPPGCDTGTAPGATEGGPGPATLPLGDASRPVAGRVPETGHRQWEDAPPLFPPGG